MPVDVGDRPVVIFDGVCNLCNGTVDFIIRHDRDGLFLFTASQDAAGAQILAEAAKGSEAVDHDGLSDSVFLWHNGQLHERSAAILGIARKLPFPWRLLAAGIIVPPTVRNWLYDLVARNRYRWFGQKDTCRIPTPAERDRFLP